MRVRLWNYTLLPVALLAACAPDTDTEGDLATDTTAVAPAQEAPAVAGGDMTEADVVSFLNTANTAEIQAAELAQQQSQNEEVRQYAQQMITDHTQANEMLGQAGQTGAATDTQSEAARTLRDEAASTMQRLQGLTGAEFDRAYIDSQVQMHQRVLDQLDQATGATTAGGQLSTQLQTLRPTLESHLQRAQQLQQTLQQTTG